MDISELLIKVAGILEKLKVPYAVTGGVAVSIWGRVRFTADIDIVIEILPDKVDKLIEELSKSKKGVYIDIEEGVTVRELAQRGSFNLIDTESDLRVDFMIPSDAEFGALELKRAVAKKIGEESIFFISPEDLILSKLRWYKESGSDRQLEDIQSIFAISKIDLQYIKKWAEEQGTAEILEKLLKHES